MTKPRADQLRQVGFHEVMPVIHHHKARPMSRELNALLEPGMLVRHPDEPDWGLGQVQSNIGGRVTVNFENAGKVVINGDRVALVMEF